MRKVKYTKAPEGSYGITDSEYKEAMAENKGWFHGWAKDYSDDEEMAVALVEDSMGKIVKVRYDFREGYILI